MRPLKRARLPNLRAPGSVWCADLFAWMPDFRKRLLELGEVLEVFIDGGKADVRDLVQALEFLHHQFADITGIDFAAAAGEQLFLDRCDGGVDRFGLHGPLAQRQHPRTYRHGRPTKHSIRPARWSRPAAWPNSYRVGASGRSSWHHHGDKGRRTALPVCPARHACTSKLDDDEAGTKLTQSQPGACKARFQTIGLRRL